MNKLQEIFDQAKLQEAHKIKENYLQGNIDLALAKAQMKAHVGSLTPGELAYMEQLFENQEIVCQQEDLASMLAIFEDVLVENPLTNLPEGHPLKNYLAENQAIRKVLTNLQQLVEKGKYIKNQWDELIEQLQQFKIHLSRKQNQLYSALEQKGFNHPTEVMWNYDNLIKEQLSQLQAISQTQFKREDFRQALQTLKKNLLDLMDKEDNILYPTSLEILSPEDFAQMPAGDREIGYCLITPAKTYEEKLPPAKEQATSENNDFLSELQALLAKYNLSHQTSPQTKLTVAEGKLTLEEINLIFKHLPVDLSYVDEKDIVAFYSDTKHRVFPRSKGVIGRHVENCHPQTSVPIVKEIIEKFKEGSEDKAEFWLSKGDSFIYILYTAVRDEKGNFRGVLEMMQECGHIRSLQGNQTLLNWNKPASPANPSIKLKTIDPQIKVVDFFNNNPGFKEFLLSKDKKFAMLKSPLFDFMKHITTMETASKESGLGMDNFNKLYAEFQLHKQ